MIARSVQGEMKTLVLFLIRGYQLLISPIFRVFHTMSMINMRIMFSPVPL